MKRAPVVLCAIASLLLVTGCALRSTHVTAAPADAQEFEAWDCSRIQREKDQVQRRATRVAYAFDERAGNNIIAMGLGMSVFWPALLTMRPTKPEAQELAALKGRFEALAQAARLKSCEEVLSATELQQLAVRPGDVVTYEQRTGQRGPVRILSARVSRMTTQGLELDGASTFGNESVFWQFDRLGNLLRAPFGPIWPQLLRSDLELGAVVSGELTESSEGLSRARVRGQVVAVGPQAIGDRQIDAAVIDLFGDAQTELGSARLDGVLVVDRGTGLLVRLDLYSPMATFQLQRRLVRIQSQP